jgi:hypothetical protein
MAVETIGATTASSLGTTVTSNASANTKGTYAVLSASTSDACDGVIVVIGRTSVSTDFLVDIATGAESSETDLISNLPVQSRSSVFTTPAFYIPVPISAGTRITARCQSNTGGASCTVLCYLISFDNVHVDSDTTAIVTYGATTADSGGTSIDPGGVANTKGSYVEITSSTTADAKFIIPMVAGQNNAIRTGGSWLLDIAKDSGPEVDIISNLYFDTHTNTDSILPTVYPPIPVEVSSGTRLAVRAQSDITDATDRLLDVILITVNGTASGGSGGGGFSAWIGK